MQLIRTITNQTALTQTFHILMYFIKKITFNIFQVSIMLPRATNKYCNENDKYVWMIVRM